MNIEDIKKEIELLLKRANEVLKATDSSNNKTFKKQHLIALGSVLALNDLKYSINNNNYLYKKEVK